MPFPAITAIRLKSLSTQFKVVFHLAIFFDQTNVSVQVILFPLNIVLRASLTFFDMESKRSAQTMLILLIFTSQGTFDISLQWWLLIRSKFFLILSNRKTLSCRQNLISFNHLFSYNIIINYYHLVSIYEKNRDHYLLEASLRLC